MHQRVWVRIGMAFVASLTVVSACGGSDTEKLRAAALSEGCLINTDCTSPLVCAFRRCHDECETSRDCSDGQRCLASDRPFHVCQLPDEKDCAYNSECPSGLLCAVDGQCRDQCSGDRDCLPGSVCVSRACAEPSELDEQGNLTPAGAVDPSGQACAYSSQCEAPLVCRLGACVKECLADVDCPAGGTCTADGACVSGGTGGAGGTGGSGTGATGGGGGAPDASAPGPECTFNSDCVGKGPGYRCLDRACVPECVTNLDCGGGETCQSGECVFMAPPGAPPEYGAGCTLTSDCVPGLTCVGGRCVFECVTGADCAIGACCSPTHYCVSGLACGSADSGPPVVVVPPDGGAGTGASCVADAECQDGLQCNGAERCVAGACQNALRSLCDDDNSCTDDQCEEATGTCTYVQLAAQDADGDGHFPVSCGGDDCDDGDPARFAGNPEKCDNIDNNCNGVVDEGVWKLGTAQALPRFTGANTTRYGGTSAEVGLAARTDGTVYVAAAADFVETGAQEASVDVWRLDTNLGVLDGPTQALFRAETGGTSIFSHPALATDGTGLAVGSYQRIGVGGNCSANEHAVVSAAGASTASLASADLIRIVSGCSPLPNLGNTRAPVLTWAGTQYLGAWADTRDGTLRAYVGGLSAAGVAGTSTLVADAASSAVSTGTESRPVYIVAGATSAFVAWIPPTGSPKYSVLDAGTLSTVVGPLDLPSGLGSYARITGADVIGSSAYLMVQNQEAAHLYVIDMTTGVISSDKTVTMPTTTPAARFAKVASGWLITGRNGNIVNFAHQANDLTTGVSFTDLSQPADIGPVSIVDVSSTQAVLSWASADDVWVASATCQ